MHNAGALHQCLERWYCSSLSWSGVLDSFGTLCPAYHFPPRFLFPLYACNLLDTQRALMDEFLCLRGNW